MKLLLTFLLIAFATAHYVERNAALKRSNKALLNALKALTTEQKVGQDCSACTECENKAKEDSCEGMDELIFYCLEDECPCGKTCWPDRGYAELEQKVGVCTDQQSDCSFLKNEYGCSEAWVAGTCCKSCGGTRNIDVASNECSKDATCFNYTYPCDSCCTTGKNDKGQSCFSGDYTQERCCKA